MNSKKSSPFSKPWEELTFTDNFICTKDPFEYGLPVYDVKKTFKNTEIEYNDYVHTIFYNAACYEKVENPTLRSFLQYVHNRKIENDFTSKIDEAHRIMPCRMHEMHCP